MKKIWNWIKKEIKNIITIIIIILLFFVCCFNFSNFKFHYLDFKISYLFGLLIFIIILLQDDKISSFSGFGLKIELKKKIEEADKLIKILKNLVVNQYVIQLQTFLKDIDISSEDYNAGEMQEITFSEAINKIDGKIEKYFSIFSNYFNNDNFLIEFKIIILEKVVYFIKYNLFSKQLNSVCVYYLGWNGFVNCDYNFELSLLNENEFYKRIEDIKTKIIKEENYSRVIKVIDELLKLYKYYESKLEMIKKD